MPEIHLSLDEAIVFTELEDGDYPVVVQEFSEVKKGEKSHYVTVTLAVEEGHENAGALCWQNLMIDGKAAGFFVDFYNKCTGGSLTVEEFRDEGFDVDTDDLIGSELTVIIKQEEYPEGSGEFKAQVDKILVRD